MRGLDTDAVTHAYSDAYSDSDPHSNADADPSAIQPGADSQQ